MYLTLTLNPSIDHYASVKTLNCGSSEAPSVNRCYGESFEGGGKGINVSKILHRLSAPVTATGFTAGFTGREVVRTVTEEGIAASFIDVPGNTRINLKIRDESGIETEINGSGPKIGPGDITMLIDSILNTEADTLFISGSVPSSCPSDTYSLIIKAVLGKEPSVRIILDCEGEMMRKCLPFRPFLVKPNAHELAQLTGTDINTGSALTEIRSAASKLIKSGARNVLVSLGSNGACLLTEDGVFLTSSGIETDVVSTIGAGDTMLAAFTYMFDKTHDYRKSLDFSNACAVCAVRVQGLPSAANLSETVREFA